MVFLEKKEVEKVSLTENQGCFERRVDIRCFYLIFIVLKGLDFFLEDNFLNIVYFYVEF